MLLIGPGVGGNGSIPPFCVAHAKGITVCIVRPNLSQIISIASYESDFISYV